MGPPVKRIRKRRATRDTLARAAVGPRVRARYDAAFSVFREYLRVHERPLHRFAFRNVYQLERRAEWDTEMERYIERMKGVDSDPRDLPPKDSAFRFAHGSWSGNLLYCSVVDVYPELKDQLPRALRALVAWHRGEETDPAPPLPKRVAVAAAGQMFSTGDDEAAICLLTQFDVFVRPAELFSMQRLYLQFNKSNVRAGVGVGLWGTKTSKGVHEHVVVRDPGVCVLLYHYYGTSAPERYLWSQSPQAFRDRFYSALAALGLESYKFRPYSVRRGGATADFAHHQSWDVSCDRGRWANARTARIYLKDALASTLEASFTAEMRRRIAKYYGYTVRAVEQAERKVFK